MNPSALNSRVLFDLWPFSGWLLTGSCGLTAPNSINNKNPEAIHSDWVISGQHRQLSPPSRILPRSLLVHLTCISLPANHGNSFLLDQFSDPNQTRASTQTFKLGKRIRSNRLLKNKRGQTKKNWIKTEFTYRIDFQLPPKCRSWKKAAGTPGPNNGLLIRSSQAIVDSDDPEWDNKVRKDETMLAVVWLSKRSIDRNMEEDGGCGLEGGGWEESFQVSQSIETEWKEKEEEDLLKQPAHWHPPMNDVPWPVKDPQTLMRDGPEPAPFHPLLSTFYGRIFSRIDNVKYELCWTSYRQHVSWLFRAAWKRFTRFTPPTGPRWNRKFETLEFLRLPPAETHHSKYERWRGYIRLHLFSRLAIMENKNDATILGIQTFIQRATIANDLIAANKAPCGAPALFSCSKFHTFRSMKYNRATDNIETIDPWKNVERIGEGKLAIAMFMIFMELP